MYYSICNTPFEILRWLGIFCITTMKHSSHKFVDVFQLTLTPMCAVASDRIVTRNCVIKSVIYEQHNGVIIRKGHRKGHTKDT